MWIWKLLQRSREDNCCPSQDLGTSCFLPIQVHDLLDEMIIKGPSNFTVVALKVASTLVDLYRSPVSGVPAMVQWVKNTTTAFWVTMEMQVSALHSGLKYPALLKLWRRSCLWLRFDSWLVNFHILQVWQLKKKNEESFMRKQLICTWIQVEKF